MANAAVSIKPMMTQFAPNVSILTSSWVPSFRVNQTSGRQGGRPNQHGNFSTNARLPAAGTRVRAPDFAASADANGFLREAIPLRALASLQGVDGDQRSEVTDEHQCAENQFAG